MNTERALARLSEVIRRKTLHSPQSGVAPPGSDDIATTLKGFPLIDQIMRTKTGRFLNALDRKGVATSTQKQAFNAMILFYKEPLGVELKNVQALRAKRPAQIRH